MSVRLETRNGVAILTIDNPPVNAIGQDVRQRLVTLADELEQDGAIRAVVLIGAGKLFVGGADISEFDRPVEEPSLPAVIARIEQSSKPWIVAIRGSALGGGLELALACHYRLVTRDARLALPEVNLGIIPGAGGTQRLPRLIGAEAASRVVAENHVLDGDACLATGLADHLVAEPLLDAALDFAIASADQPLPAPSGERSIPSPSPDFWQDAAERLKRSAKGASAPLIALHVMRHGLEQGFASGLARERDTFLTLRSSEEAAALRYLFFAERAAPRPQDLRQVETLTLARSGVVGGGTMGVGIAAALSNAGLPVVMIERDAPSLERGLAGLRKIFEAVAKKSGAASSSVEDRMATITGSTDYASLADCDLVIEAVFEELSVKRDVFEALGQHCRRDAILATNTSYLDPRRIAEGLPSPERFIGLHFFSPAQVMKLVEIIPVPETGREVLATAFELSRKLGKMPIRSGICDGFIGNRILRRYRTEAEAMIREGVGPEAIDAAMRDFGYAMGPFEMQDMAGLDIAFLHRQAARASGEDVPLTPADLLVQAGRKGQKTGGGWYDYRQGERRPIPSDDARRIISPLVTGQQDLPPETIVSRLIDAMADEGRQILREGIAASPADIDLVEVHGYGFPRKFGGPMFLSARRETQVRTVS